ncbi:MAG: tRNA (guanosine(37)-N1)-methyltransferase TrmD [Candidatus Muproteobacteria bacterium RBG_16_64_10]|uniref:tRNA (guanine-N(1)-)-methyltransferase n=1 Tax=Candidatus Muproteobacteria bacterium RBG_16_64_10 TaxID=1817757 RepID=A0A1F6T659_9PROT|nr:MAG: tRNA (guanosine(37)-N1)-methyltransferase TrmD [Candidatus Muproteobacteria bacterium RBG_16_64_10]
MRIDVISIFPAMFEAITGYGIPGRAIKKELLQLRVWNPRDFTDDRHRSVDDRPYGGGPGMVMLTEPLAKTLAAARVEQPRAKVIYLSPQGRRLDHAAVKEFAQREGLILLAGRYEGVDERLLASEVDEEWSIGDYVLSGGELPAMVLIDAIARQLPGALGDEDSAAQDSFVAGLLDCPHYTRPEVYDGRPVPEVLLSGNHEQIRRWRLKQMLGRTWLRRPELLAKLELTDEQRKLLDEFKREQGKADS